MTAEGGMAAGDGWDEAPVRPFRPLELRELVTLTLPAPEWVVAGLLPRGSATILTAREKAGKRLLALDLCAAVATGEPFLGRATMLGPAIYAAAEEHLALLRDRLRLENPEEFARLLEMVRERRPALLVLDTLRELHDRAEDRSDEMGPLLRPLRQLAHQFGVALVVTHHQNTGQEFRGSTAIRAAFDQEWSFRRSDGADDGAPAGTLTVEGRYGAKQRLRVRLGDGLRWEVGGGEEPAGGRRGPSLRDRIPFFLADRPEGATAGEIVIDLGASVRTVNDTITRMLAEQPPVLVASGSGTKNDPRRVRLAESAPTATPGQLALPRWWSSAPTDH